MSLTNFPSGLDTFTDPSSGQFLNSPSHSQQHGLANDALAALQAKVGINSSGVTTSFDYKLSGVTGTDKAVSLTGTEVLTNKTLTTPNLGASGSNTTSPLTVTGSQGNINLNLVPKGSGVVQDNGSNLIDFRSSFQNFVSSGCVWTQVSGLNGTMTAGTVWISGKEVTVATVATNAFAASNDTYVDVDNTGTLFYSAVANNAASPALTAGRIRLAIIVCNGSAITVVNQGDVAATAPVASSVVYTVTDSIGNLIYPLSPNPTLIGYRPLSSSVTFTTTSVNTDVDVTGLTAIPCIVPANRRIRIRVVFWSLTKTGSAGDLLIVKIKEGSTQLQETDEGIPGSNYNIPATCEATPTLPSAGAHTYKIAVNQNSAGTVAATVTSATKLTYALVELI